MLGEGVMGVGGRRVENGPVSSKYLDMYVMKKRVDRRVDQRLDCQLYSGRGPNSNYA